ncbi:2OG-Fe(II) oxygenase [Pseudomonas palleroniana]|uniref:2OG-Fe(II) oxygenase n=1 Tax=Pseudomonas palleroniana TaxID=191390 RepID=UPI001FD5D656|nr:2OG-Fe(II) oxygenase [Pseudomonas palleroniana]UOP10518.1 2OG-Fe(II) oxygenase [Pseudomonas palleroniana]
MNRIDTLDWQSIRVELDQQGFAVLPGFLGPPNRAREQLPALLNSLRQEFYAPLAQIANQWNLIAGRPYGFPLQRSTDQRQPSSPLMCLREGESLALGQDIDDERGFAFQLTALLSSPGQDFTGGELVLIEQRPRMQSRPMVVPLRLGDLAIITTAHRPFKGRKGYYRVTMKRAISRVRSGERVGFFLNFHGTSERVHG